MKAVLCKAFGEPDTLVLEEIDSPQVNAGEVKIRIRACGVNFPDLLMVQGKYQVRPPFPFSPGLEIAGDVLEVGAGVDHVKVGARVMATINHGGFAEEAVVPAMMTMPLPDNMSYEHGAVFPLVYGTSHVGLERRASLQAGETLLVLGAAGGVGLTAVELGKVMGATVIAAASTEEKLELTRAYGADYTINYTREPLRDRVKEITDGKFADVIYDPVGGDIFDESIRCVAWEGRYLVIGFASGRIPELPINRVLIKNSALVGLYWGAYMFNNPAVIQKSFQRLFTWYSEGKLKPHVDRSFSLEDAPQALIALGNREAKGKFVVVP